MKNQNQTNYFLNYLKGLACMGIVLIHCRFPSVPGAVISAFARTGIPFFFMLSGYYTFFADKETTLVVTGRRIKKTLQLLVAAMICYIGWRFLPKLLSGGIAEAMEWLSLAIFQSQNIFDFLLFNVTDSINGVLWYIPAALYVYLLFGILVKIFGKRYFVLYLTASILLIVNLVLCELGTVLEFDIHLKWYRNFLLTGYPFFMLGHYLHNKEKNIQLIKNKNIPLLISVLGTVMIIMESRFVGNALLYTGNVVFITGLYLYAIQNGNSKKGTLIEQIGSNLYLYIYISQVAVIEVVGKFWERIPFFAGDFGLYAKPVLVLGLVILFSAFLHFAQLKNPYKKMKG